ncbi:MAG: Uncharacterized MFS-type transporter, partial [uncultured Friedmanniella sp.]
AHLDQPPLLGRLGRGGRGLRGGDLPAHLPGRRGGPRGGALRHRGLGALDVRGAAARRLRRHADPGGDPGRPVRLAAAAGRRGAADGARADGDGAGEPAGDRRAGPRGRRRRRRHDVHLGAAGDPRVVSSPPSAAGHPADGAGRPARPGRQHHPASGGAGGPGLDPRLPRGGGDRGAGRRAGPAGRPRPARGSPGARAGGLEPGAGRPAQLVHPPRHPAGAVVALQHPVLGDGVRAALGLSVHDRRTGLQPGPRGQPAHPHGAGRTGDRPGAGPAHRPVPAAPVEPDLRRADRHGGHLDARARLAGDRPAAPAGPAAAGAGRLRAGLCRRLRLRPLLQPVHPAGCGVRDRQHGRLHGVADHDLRHRGHPGLAGPDGSLRARRLQDRLLLPVPAVDLRLPVPVEQQAPDAG